MTIASNILKKAGDFILNILRVEGSVCYSQFYDGTVDVRMTLLESLDMSADDADFYGAEALIDDVVILFEKAGIVETRLVDEMLCDGTQNYAIELTEFGRTFIADGEIYHFPDLEMHL